MVERSTPFCSAMRRARGDAMMRSPLSSFGAAGALVSVSTDARAGLALSRGAALAGSDLSSDSSLAGFSSAGSLSPDGAAAAASSTSSPSSARMAITVPTFTPSVPASTAIEAIVPSSTASNSIVALSVSISAMMSPALTVSPGFTSHLASVPSSMVGERAGILIGVGMAVYVTSSLGRLCARTSGEKVRSSQGPCAEYELASNPQPRETGSRYAYLSSRDG